MVMATVRLSMWGNSSALRIPKPILKQMGIDENATVSISVTDNNELLVKPVYRRKTLEERFAGWDGGYAPEVIDWGEPVGEEAW